MKITPIRDNIVAKRIEERDEKKVGSIIIPDTAKEKPMTAGTSPRVTPAMEAGITNTVHDMEWNTVHDMEWIVSLIDARAPKPGPRGPYRKRQQAA